MGDVLDPGDNWIVGNADVFVHCNCVGLLAELGIVVIVVQHVHVDRGTGM